MDIFLHSPEEALACLNLEVSKGPDKLCRAGVPDEISWWVICSEDFALLAVRYSTEILIECFCSTYAWDKW